MKYCFYHSADHDGHCSGMVMKKVYPEIQLVPIDYGDESDFDYINENDVVFMVDFHLEPMEQMVELGKKCTLICIDHHVSAKEDYDALSDVDKQYIKLYYNENKKSGCELAYEFTIDEYTPYFIKLISLYDTWQHDKDKNALPFEYGLRAYETNPILGMTVWNYLWNDDGRLVDQIVKKGKTILKYQKKVDAEYLNSYYFDVTLNGHKCIACNKGRSSSMMFEDQWDNKKYDMMISFVYTGDDGWSFSLYSDRDDIDCSQIAKQYGGGGHKGAAGFSSKTLPFD